MALSELYFYIFITRVNRTEEPARYLPYAAARNKAEPRGPCVKAGAL